MPKSMPTHLQTVNDKALRSGLVIKKKMNLGILNELLFMLNPSSCLSHTTPSLVKKEAEILVYYRPKSFVIKFEQLL